MENKVKVLIVLTGVRSTYYIINGKASLTEMKKAAHINGPDTRIDFLLLQKIKIFIFLTLFL